jgi:hypothetical protein
LRGMRVLLGTIRGWYVMPVLRRIPAKVPFPPVAAICDLHTIVSTHNGCVLA